MAIELAYINTKHPDFHRDAELVSLMMKSAEEDEYSRQRMLRKYNVNNSTTGCDRDVSVNVDKLLLVYQMGMAYPYSNNFLVIFIYFNVFKSVASTGSLKKTPKQHQADMNSEMNSVESSPATTPVHQTQNECMPSTIASSFSSMDLQSPSNRNLSEKELRDCDVIGTYLFPLKDCYNIVNLSNAY